MTPDRPDQGRASADTLVPLVYDELRRLASRQRYRLSRGREALTTTALVHEAYLKLRRQAEYRGEQHLLAVAATAMRQLLVDEARRLLAAKRGGAQQPETLTASERSVVALEPEESQMVIDVDSALSELGKQDERLLQIVECRFFAGLTVEETATALDLNARTIQRDWARARDWLRGLLEDHGTS